MAIRTKQKSSKGAPFPQDVAKRRLLDKVLKENNFNPQVVSFLEECKKRVQRDIDEEIQRDDIRLKW